MQLLKKSCTLNFISKSQTFLFSLKWSLKCLILSVFYLLKPLRLHHLLFFLYSFRSWPLNAFGPILWAVEQWWSEDGKNYPHNVTFTHTLMHMFERRWKIGCVCVCVCKSPRNEQTSERSWHLWLNYECVCVLMGKAEGRNLCCSEWTWEVDIEWMTSVL